MATPTTLTQQPEALPADAGAVWRHSVCASCASISFSLWLRACGRSCSWSRWRSGSCACVEEDPHSANRVMEAIDHLAQAGPGLGRPLVDRVHHSHLSNLKELRPGSAGRSEIRLLFVFDAERQAVILVAGDKTGQWNAWYRENIPIAEDRYERYVNDRKEEGR